MTALVIWLPSGSITVVFGPAIATAGPPSVKLVS